MEKAAEWMNKRYEAQPGEPHECLEWVGWTILMVGIVVESSVACSSAIDEWQTKQIANKNDPLNQLIASAIAHSCQKRLSSDKGAILAG